MLIATSTSEDRFYMWVDLYTYKIELDIRHYPLNDNSAYARHCPLKNLFYSDKDLIDRAAEVVKR